MPESMLDRVAAAIDAVPSQADVRAQRRAEARAAILAMREPTEAMLEAPERSDVLIWSPEPGEGLDSINYDEVWYAMIDAALSGR